MKIDLIYGSGYSFLKDPNFSLSIEIILDKSKLFKCLQIIESVSQ